MIEIRANTINWNQKCWKYFNVDRFIESLENNYLYFASANQFEDAFEGATRIVDAKNTDFINKIPNFKFINEAFMELKTFTKISCWHKAEFESNMMWKYYANDMKGIAITSTPLRMKDAIKPYRIKPEYGFEELYIGNVEYINLSENPIKDTMLNIFIYKHMVFESEQELRLLISLRQAHEYGVKIPKMGIFVEVDYAKLIENIVIGPNISSEHRIKIMEVIRNKGLESKLQESSLIQRPLYV